MELLFWTMIETEEWVRSWVFFSFVWVCMCAICVLHVCVHVHIGVYTCVCRCACLCQKSMFYLLSLHLIFGDMVSHWTWSSTFQLEWLAREPWGSASPSTKCWNTVLLLLALVWVLRIQTQMPTLLQHKLSSLCFHPRTRSSFIITGLNSKHNYSFTLYPRKFIWPFQVSLPYLSSRDSTNCITLLWWLTEIIQ